MFTKKESAKKVFIKEIFNQDFNYVRVLGDVVFKFLGENRFVFPF